jgi:hypothetical protein
MPDVRAVAAGRDTLRLYAALTPAQQQALWRGLPVPAVPLVRADRSLFQAALERIKPKDVTLSAAELAAARLSLTAQPEMMDVEPHPGGITYQLQSLPAAADGRSMAPLAAASDGVPPRAATQKLETIRRYPVLQITFHYRVGAQQFDLAPLTVAAPERQ